MNKYIKSVSEALNIEHSIGRGSVLLIKGKPTPGGRRLYVTTITGWTEFKPGLKMVFIGDTIYRVIHKGGDNFSGRKVSISIEDGLKGVLNMKNPGRPSLVLNHNKTPFHWITLKHTDIGSALRSIGGRLFDHELILESSSISKEEENRFIVSELIKKLAGQPSAIVVQSIEPGDEYNINDFEEDAEESDDTFEAKWDVYFNVLLDDSKLDKHWINHFEGSQILESEWELMDNMGLTPEVPDVTLCFSTVVDVRHSGDSGDYWTPPSHDVELGEPQTEVLISDISQDEYSKLKKDLMESRLRLKSLDSNSPEYSKLSKDITEKSRKIYSNDIPHMYEGSVGVALGKDPYILKMIYDIEIIIDKCNPTEAFEVLEAMSGIGENSEDLRNNSIRKIKYIERRKTINKEGLSKDDILKWSNLSSEYFNYLQSNVQKLIDEHRELEERDSLNSDNPLTDGDIKRSEEIFEWLDNHLPKIINRQGSFSSFKYAKRNWVESEKNWSIYRMNTKGIEHALNEFNRKLGSMDYSLKALEDMYNDATYKLDTLSGRKVPHSLAHKVKYLNIFLNPDHQIQYNTTN